MKEKIIISIILLVIFTIIIVDEYNYQEPIESFKTEKNNKYKLSEEVIETVYQLNDCRFKMNEKETKLTESIIYNIDSDRVYVSSFKLGNSYGFNIVFSTDKKLIFHEGDVGYFVTQSNKRISLKIGDKIESVYHNSGLYINSLILNFEIYKLKEFKDEFIQSINLKHSEGTIVKKIDDKGEIKNQIYCVYY